MVEIRRFRKRTLPVLLAGIGSLLALLFLPGVIALKRTEAVYGEIRRIQESHQETQRALAEIERRVYLISLTMREALLDSSAVSGAHYKGIFTQQRAAIEREIAELELQPLSRGSSSVTKLEQELEKYMVAIEPVFNWTPAERSARAMYFLREQQRPRRQSIIDIAEEIGALAKASYAKQLDQVNSSQTEFGTEIRQAIGAAFLIGLIIAVFTLVRMRTLEERAGRHQAKTEQAEEELRGLSTKLMQMQEEERKTISRELHDEVGQTLTGLRMGLGSLEKLREDESGFHEQVAEMKGLAESALRAVRDIAVGLRPSVLDLGLVPALQWQARRFSKYAGVPATVHNEGNLEEVPEAYRTCIYRVVQECLTNAVKHSAAKAVRVEILESGGKLRVAVQDDGSGMPNGRQRGGVGLIGMEERVRELGGTLTVEPSAGGGTSVVVNLAMPNGAGERR